MIMINCIQTFTGQHFDIQYPDFQIIDIRDIAHALSLKCRFNGHCKTFYSVAEHSVRVSMVSIQCHKLWALLHDSAEAYLPDIPSPVKFLFPEISVMEFNILNALSMKYNLPPYHQSQIHIPDKILLATEARDLMPHPDTFDCEGCEPLLKTIVPFTPHQAETAFLNAFHLLTNYKYINHDNHPQFRRRM